MRRSHIKSSRLGTHGGAITHSPPPDRAPTSGDREQAIARLKRHYAAGHVDLQEYEARVDRVIDATEVSAIEDALARLPRGRASSPDTVTSTETAAVELPGGRQAIVAVLSAAVRRGVWAVPRALKVIGILGGARLDLREAEFADDVVEIDATAVLGEVKIIAPDDLTIDMSGVGILGEVKDTAHRAKEGAVTVRITALALLGSVEVKVVPADR